MTKRQEPLLDTDAVRRVVGHAVDDLMEQRRTEAQKVAAAIRPELAERGVAISDETLLAVIEEVIGHFDYGYDGECEP